MKAWTQILRKGHDLLLPTRLNNGPIDLLIVDTGSYTNLISREAAQQVAHVESDKGIRISGISGEVKDVYQTGPVSLAFAGLRQPTPYLTAISTAGLSYDAGIEISGFLGAPTLHKLTIHIDYRDNLMRFDYDPSRLQHCLGGNALARGRDLPDCVQ